MTSARLATTKQVAFKCSTLVSWIEPDASWILIQSQSYEAAGGWPMMDLIRSLYFRVFNLCKMIITIWFRTS